MINSLIILLLILLIDVCSAQERESVIPLKDIRNKSHVTVKVGNVVIPDILLDTGFAFDGLMIYNPDYKDSLDLTDAMEVKIGGAGSGEASTALMVDSAAFSLDDITMRNQRLLVLQGDLYKGFPSNGIIGYSITQIKDYISNLIHILRSLIKSELSVIEIALEGEGY